MQQISFEGQVEGLMVDGSQCSFGAIIQGGVFNDQSPFVLRSSGVNVSLKTGPYHHNTNPIPVAVFGFVQVAFSSVIIILYPLRLGFISPCLPWDISLGISIPFFQLVSKK